MIIISMSRKDRSACGQLIRYIANGASSAKTLSWNLSADADDLAEVAEEFRANANHLPERKNGNIVYHEIISLPDPLEDEASTEAALFDLGKEYLKNRAPHCLAFGQVHNTSKPHLHLLISANAVRSSTRHRLDRHEFLTIQQSLEEYKRNQFPSLHRKLYAGVESKLARRRTFDREQIEQRRPLSSKLLTIKSSVSDILASSAGPQEALRRLEKAGWEFYRRGQQFGLRSLHSPQKIRLTTLGLEDLVNQMRNQWNLAESLKEKRRRSSARSNVRGRYRQRELA